MTFGTWKKLKLNKITKTMLMSIVFFCGMILEENSEDYYEEIHNGN